MNTITSPTTRSAFIDHEATHQRSPLETQDKTRVETDISELVLCAQAEMAMARVTGPILPRSCFAHAASAKGWAFRAGLAARSGACLPTGFLDSMTLREGFEAGQAVRRESINHLSLVAC